MSAMLALGDDGMPIRGRSPEELWQIAEGLRDMARDCAPFYRSALRRIADHIDDEGNRRDHIEAEQPNRDYLLSNLAQFLAGSGDREAIHASLSHDVAWFVVHHQPHLFREESHGQPDPC